MNKLERKLLSVRDRLFRSLPMEVPAHLKDEYFRRVLFGAVEAETVRLVGGPWTDHISLSTLEKRGRVVAVVCWAKDASGQRVLDSIDAALADNPSNENPN